MGVAVVPEIVLALLDPVSVGEPPGAGGAPNAAFCAAAKGDLFRPRVQAPVVHGHAGDEVVVGPAEPARGRLLPGRAVEGPYLASRGEVAGTDVQAAPEDGHGIGGGVVAIPETVRVGLGPVGVGGSPHARRAPHPAPAGATDAGVEAAPVGGHAFDVLTGRIPEAAHVDPLPGRAVPGPHLPSRVVVAGADIELPPVYRHALGHGVALVPEAARGDLLEGGPGQAPHLAAVPVV